MMNIKGIFAVSLIAMVAMVAGAHTSNAVAAIASQGYVDQQVGSKLSSISGSTTGSGNVVTVVSASGSTVSVTKGITAEETKNKVTSVSAVASATDTAYPSEKAVATALAGKADATDLAHKVDIYQGDAKANQAVITNGSGNIITGFITKSMLGEDVVIPDEYELPPATTSALGGVKSGGDIDVDTSGAVTVKSARSATNAKNATNATNDAEGNDIISTYATKNELTTASDILTETTVTSSGTGAVLTGVSVTAGKVTLQKGNVQIPSGGQDATSYVSIWVE